MNAKTRTVDLLDSFIQDCKFRNLSPKTIKDYDWFLTDTKNKLGELSELTRDNIKQLVLEKLNDGQSPATSNHYIRAIKAFFSFLCREEHIDKNTMAGLPLISMPDKLKPVIKPSQVTKMINTIPEKGFFNIRDRTMITVLFDTAIRLNELLHIKLANVDLTNNQMKVFGKGRKDRMVPFGRKTKKELIKYIKVRGENYSEFLFCTHTGYAVMPRNFRRTLNRCADKIGIKVSPHLLRHSAATFLAKNEMPAQHIQILLGHSNLATTQRYINQIVNQEGLQISHRRLSPADRL